jgi:hypothetical protein
MGETNGGSRRAIGRPPASATLFFAFAVVALVGGCEPFPLHTDPLSINGRDGGGPPLSYDALMRIGTAARNGGDLANAVSVFRRAAELAPGQPAPFVAIGDTMLVH